MTIVPEETLDKLKQDIITEYDTYTTDHLPKLDEYINRLYELLENLRAAWNLDSGGTECDNLWGYIETISANINLLKQDATLENLNSDIIYSRCDEFSGECRKKL